MLLVAAMMVASAPPIFAQDGGCQNGQTRAWDNAWIYHDNDKQDTKHMSKMIDCTLDQPPGEGQ
jgi:hypothetical protein